MIPWLAIEEAAPKGGPGSSEVRIRVVGEDEVTVFCGDADAAAAAILERRDLARRMRSEREPA